MKEFIDFWWQVGAAFFSLGITAVACVGMLFLLYAAFIFLSVLLKRMCMRGERNNGKLL